MNYNDILMHHYSSSDFLCHHGILGQKWGIRRFQNKDGSLTEAGKKRYYDRAGHITKAGAKAFVGKDEKLTAAGRAATEYLTGYSDEEKLLSITNKEELANRLEQQTDFRSIKDKAEKERKETELLDTWYGDWDSLNQKQQDLCVALHRRITKESGSWYFSEGVSDGFKQYINETRSVNDALNKRGDEIKKKHPFLSISESIDKFDNDPEVKKLYKQQGALNEKLLSTVLNDIGYEDTEELRRKIRPMVFDD